MGDNNDAVEKTKLASSSPSPSIGAVFKQADTMDKWLMTLGTLGAVADGFFMPLLLLITSNIINELGRGASFSSSRFVHLIDANSLYIVYLACGSWVAAFLEGYCWTRTGERQGSRMLTRYLKAVLRQDVEYFDHRTVSTTEVVTAVSNDSLIVQDFLSEKMPNLIMNCSTLVSSYLASFIMMWRLTLVAFPTMFIFITPMLICGKMLMDVALKIGVEYTKAGYIAQQAISSIRTVYSFVGEQKTMSEFSTALDVSAKLGLRQGLIKGLTIGSTGAIFAVWAFLTWYGSRLVMYHGGQGGTIFAITSNVVLAGISIGLALSNVKYLSEAGSAAAGIMEMVNRVPKIDSEKEEGEILCDIAGKVEFKGVEFSYPSRPESRILNGFDLEVPPGKTVGLAGASGSGKSTVIALLQRFYDPAKGEILLDGVDIRRLQLKWLRSQMGLVSQEPALFATSIKENILFGKEDASMAKVVAAAQDASIHDFISQLPQGYDTQVGERGIQLAGGQKQRIAIARAILRNPNILLLDEATSALDSQSEKVVQEALSTASIGRTTIVIAHRLSTIRNVDVIAVVEAGRVAESGSHEQLIANKDGLYASLLQLQQIKSEAHEEEEEVAPQTSSPALKTSTQSLHQEHRISSLSTKPSTTKSNQENTKLADNVKKGHKQSNQVPSLWRLLAMNAPEWKQAMLGGVSATLSGADCPFFGYVVGGAVSVYFLEDHGEMKAKIRTYCILFLFLSIFSFVTRVGQHYWFAAMGEHLTKRVRELMLSKILSFEVGWFDQDENSTGTICASLAKDADLVRSLVGDRLAFLLQTVSAVTLGCVMSIVLTWRLALVIIAVEPLIIFAFYARRALLKNMSTKVTNAQLESGKLAVEAVSNIRTITAFSSQDRIIRLLELAQEAPRKESLKQSWIAGLALGSSQCLMGCAQALGYWYGGRLVADGKATVKTMFQVIMILNSTGRVIAQAGSMTNDLTKSTNAVESIFELLDRPTEIEPEDPAGCRPEKLAGKVDLDGVHFAYPTRPSVIVLKNFSLSIESGMSMALVGRSGSGKSTIIGLMQRFYDPLKGTVCIDGKDVKSYHLRSLRRHIALVSQEPVLFASTIRENITYGVESATEAEVEAAARAASAHDLICGFKDGYETRCGDRGLQLSGGQKQRIAIARAILKNPAILLLDEATSALDNQSATAVQEALERVMLGRTCVVVAHRLSTITNSDRIAVLDKGVIVEQGTHSSLMANASSGAYFQLIKLQQSDSLT